MMPLFAPNIVVGYGRVEGQLGRRRRQPADAVRRHPRHRRLGEGGPVRAHLRRVQHPGADLRRRARLPARHRPGVERHHPPRREADLRLRRGHRPAGHDHHPQGLRRRVRRDGVQAPRRGHQPGLADRPDRGHGRPGRGQHPVPQGARRGRRPGGDARAVRAGVRRHARQPLHRGRARLRRRRDHPARDPRRGRPGAARCCAPSARRCRPRSTGTSRCEHDDRSAEPVETTPLLRIVKGDPTAEEVAALVAVVSAMAAAGAEERTGRPTPAWSAPARRVRTTLRHGSGAWRASGLP